MNDSQSQTTDFPLLVLAAQAGDNHAFDQIIARFQDMAFATAYAMLGDPGLAQDAAQEAFIDAYLSLVNLREPVAFPSWFRRIIVKHSDRQIRGKRVALVPLENAYGAYSPMPDPLDAIESLQLQEDVHRAIGLLPHNQRIVTALFYVEGYSQQEIADFLEIPITAVKKRLVNARKNLKERMTTMVQATLQATKPSQNQEFQNKVSFFLALRENDLTKIEKILESTPDMLHTKIDHCAGIPAWYWTTGLTAMGWAAGTGNIQLLNLLLERGADIEGLAEAGTRTPLHEAICLEQNAAAVELIKRGSDVNVRGDRGQVPLHYAVHKNNPEIAQLLIQKGAQLDVADRSERTPLDWAVAYDRPILVELFVSHGQGRPAGYVATRHGGKPANGIARLVPTGPTIMGNVLDSLGLPIGDEPSVEGKMIPAITAAHARKTPILATGIKTIDLFAPLKRGGHNGLFTPMAGVGKTVMMSQLVNSMISLHNGYVICIGLDHGGFTGESLMHVWRHMSADPALLSQRVVNISADIDDGPEKHLQVAETGLTIAEDLRAAGHEVLLMVDTHLAVSRGDSGDVASYLRNNTSSTPKSAITTVYHGTVTVGVEPEPLQGLDSVITFDRGRANEGLHPAIDPLRSTSALLRPELVGAEHVAVVKEIRRHFVRYAELHPMFEKAGEDALLYIEDKAGIESAKRARRLHRFLTQPLPGAEFFVGIPGVHVSVEDTVRSFRAILDGEYDDLPEDAFKFVGVIEEVVEQAKPLL